MAGPITPPKKKQKRQKALDEGVLESIERLIEIAVPEKCLHPTVVGKLLASDQVGGDRWREVALWHCGECGEPFIPTYVARLEYKLALEIGEQRGRRLSSHHPDAAAV